MAVPLLVLYVDDDEDLRDVATYALRLDESMTVRVAASGAAALALIDSEAVRPDVILLDVMMPGMDGPAVLEALRTRPGFSATPVIFVTARAHASEKSGYLKSTVAGLITKPFDPVTLAGDVRRILTGASE
jgi:CheY-like chemotaxis protein